jgi:recombinational DNA repair protein (RecF pathway)
MRAIVLSQTISGDSFQKLQFLSDEAGLFVAMRRYSQKQHSAHRPVIFDTAEIEVQTKPGSQVSFIQSYELIQRRDAIGKNYRSLEAAAKFARLLLHNSIAFHNTDAIYDLVDTSLNALAAQKSPDHVYFKALYLLLKQEGYPVRESWYAGLNATSQDTVADILKQAAPRECSQDLRCQQITEELSKWMELHTDFKRPPTQ